jgi:hypothetical protein
MQRMGTLVVIVWLIIGVVAAAQRSYFSSSKANWPNENPREARDRDHALWPVRRGGIVLSL